MLNWNMLYMVIIVPHVDRRRKLWTISSPVISTLVHYMKSGTSCCMTIIGGSTSIGQMGRDQGFHDTSDRDGLRGRSLLNPGEKIESIAIDCIHICANKNIITWYLCYCVSTCCDNVIVLVLSYVSTYCN